MIKLLGKIASLSPWWAAGALIFSAGWVVWQFIIKREAEPIAELELDLVFLAKQGEWQIIEIVAKLTNKGNVRQWYRNFRVVVRYALPNDEVVDGPKKVNYQLLCKRTIDERIGGEARFFANSAYIDPRLCFQHRYVTFVPSNAIFVWLQARMEFRRHDLWRPWKKSYQIKNSQRIFNVPVEGRAEVEAEAD